MFTHAVHTLTIVFHGVKIECQETVSSDVHWVKLVAHLIQSVLFMILCFEKSQ